MLDVPGISQLNLSCASHVFTGGKVVKSSCYDCVSVSVFAGIAALAPSHYIFARSDGSRRLIGLSCQVRLHAYGRDPGHNQRVVVLTDNSSFHLMGFPHLNLPSTKPMLRTSMRLHRGAFHPHSSVPGRCGISSADPFPRRTHSTIIRLPRT